MGTTASAATPLFGHLTPQPRDSICALAEPCRRCPRADKIGFTVGICHASDGRVPVLVAAA